MKQDDHYAVTTDGGIKLHLSVPSPDTGLRQYFTCPLTPEEAQDMAVALGTAVADHRAAMRTEAAPEQTDEPQESSDKEEDSEESTHAAHPRRRRP